MTGVVGLGSHMEIRYEKGIVLTVSGCPKVSVMRMTSPLACRLGSTKLMYVFDSHPEFLIPQFGH